MVRGRIDVLILQKRGGILLDYKTDSIGIDGVDARAEFYRPQLQAYRDAMQRIIGRKIPEMYLAFLSPRIVKKL